MRVVAALGGNALLPRGHKPDEDIQEHDVQQAVHALAPLARAQNLIVTHGNRPQVGMLALESAFPAGSMGPKVEAACRFVEATGRMEGIGRLDAAEALLSGTAGTIVSP